MNDQTAAEALLLAKFVKDLRQSELNGAGDFSAAETTQKDQRKRLAASKINNETFITVFSHEVLMNADHGLLTRSTILARSNCLEMWGIADSLRTFSEDTFDLSRRLDKP